METSKEFKDAMFLRLKKTSDNDTYYGMYIDGKLISFGGKRIFATENAAKSQLTRFINTLWITQITIDRMLLNDKGDADYIKALQTIINETDSFIRNDKALSNAAKTISKYFLDNKLIIIKPI